MDKVLAIVPARAGSKGLPGKNLAPVAGRPLLAYTIDAARAARAVERVVVTTDSPHIAAVARAYGAETPFLRPKELAGDNTPGLDPVLHAVQWLAAHESYRPWAVCCLQPTSPLREAMDIDAAFDLLVAYRADAVVSVSPALHPLQWLKRIDDTGRLHDAFDGIPFVARRQEVPPLYTLNGAVYLARTAVLLEQRTWYTDRTYAYVMPPERALDIDTAWDLYLADLVLKDRYGREHD